MNATSEDKTIKDTSLVLFGVTGDLARQKLIPSLYKLFVRGLLPSRFTITGFGRKEFSLDQFRLYVSEIIKNVEIPEKFSELKQNLIATFLQHIFYIKGQLDHGVDYERLKLHLDARRTKQNIFYLSVPPVFQKEIVEHLGWAGLLQSEEGSKSLLMVEKPFGQNEKTANELEYTIKKFLKESSVYRIDHYLGKQALQSLYKDKENFLFSHFWNDSYIEQVEVRIHEQRNVAKRAAFYDAVGALSDVGQNHLLQMLAAVVIPPSDDNSIENILKMRSKVIHTIEPIVTKQLRGQHSEYASSEGVKKDSDTETFFSSEVQVKLPQWKKTRFILSAGKALKENAADIILTFRPLKKNDSKRKKSIISINGISRKTFNQLEAYEYIFLAALKKDKTFFVSLEEAIGGWKFVRKVRAIWKKKKTPLHIYKQHTSN